MVAVLAPTGHGTTESAPTSELSQGSGAGGGGCEDGDIGRCAQEADRRGGWGRWAATAVGTARRRRVGVGGRRLGLVFVDLGGLLIGLLLGYSSFGKTLLEDV